MNTNKRSKRGVPTAISILILILIALSALIISYVWVTGYSADPNQTGNSTLPTPTPTLTPSTTPTPTSTPTLTPTPTITPSTTPTPTPTPTTSSLPTSTPTPTPTAPQETIYQLTVLVNPSEGGTVIADKTGPYQQGDVVTLIALPATNYHFSEWSIDATGTSNPIKITMDTKAVISIDGNKTVIATFLKNEQPPEPQQTPGPEHTPEPVSYSLTVDSLYGTTGGAGAYASGVTAYATVTPLTVLDVSDPENVRYVFTHWSNDASGTTSPSNAILMDASKTATANWKTQYKIQVSADPTEGGTPTITTQWYDADETVQISTTVNPAYTFIGWTASDNCATFTDASATSTTMTVNSPGIVTANFMPTNNDEPTYTYTLTSSTGDTPVQLGNMVTVTATTNDSRIDHIRFIWVNPAGINQFDETKTVSVSLSGDEFQATASSTWEPDALGTWTVHAEFLDEDDNALFETDQIVETRTTTFNVIPEVTLIGTAGIAAAMALSLLIYRKRT